MCSSMYSFCGYRQMSVNALEKSQGGGGAPSRSGERKSQDPQASTTRTSRGRTCLHTSPATSTSPSTTTYHRRSLRCGRKTLPMAADLQVPTMASNRAPLRASHSSSTRQHLARIQMASIRAHAPAWRVTLAHRAPWQHIQEVLLMVDPYNHKEAGGRPSGLVASRANLPCWKVNSLRTLSLQQRG